MTSQPEHQPGAEAPQEGGPQDTAGPASGPDAGPGTSSGTSPETSPGTGFPVTGPPAGDATDPAGTAADPAGTAADLGIAQAAVGALTEDLQRLQAEYVNYKRRVDRDRELVKENATFSVLSSLLPVLDDLDRARDHGELEGGFKAVADALERIVAAHGLIKFGRPGDEFDPRLHEALMFGLAPDVTTTTCQNIVSAGYQIGERVLRPAKVTVVDPEPAGVDQQ